MSTLENDWQHILLRINNENSRAQALATLSLLLVSISNFEGYYDVKVKQSAMLITVHYRPGNFDLLECLREKFNDHNGYSEVVISYTTSHLHGEIAQLIQGQQAEAVYHHISMSMQKFINHFNQQVASGKIKRETLVFDLMLLHMLCPSSRNIYESHFPLSDKPTSYLCYRSHIDGFITMTQNSKEIMALFEGDYARQKKQLHQRYQTLKSLLEKNELPKLYQEWIDRWEAHYKHVTEIITNGELKFIEQQTGFISDSYAVKPGSLHDKVDGDKLMLAFITRNSDFMPLRLMTGLLYVSLLRLGTTLSHRYQAAYNIAATIEDWHHFSVDEVIKNIKRNYRRRLVKKVLSLGFLA